MAFATVVIRRVIKMLPDVDYILNVSKSNNEIYRRALAIGKKIGYRQGYLKAKEEAKNEA